MINKILNFLIKKKKENNTILDLLPRWEITLSEHIDFSAGKDDPVLAESLALIKAQTGLDYEDLIIEKGPDGFAVIKPK